MAYCPVALLLAVTAIANAAYHMEKLDRGVVVVPASPPPGVLVSWRLLGTDPADISFNVYHGSTKLNSNPIMDRTNYYAKSGLVGSAYSVRPVINGTEQTDESAISLTKPYLSVKITPPPPGKTPTGEEYTYEANDGEPVDLDGDGRYEIVLKWLPTNQKDNSQSGYTGNTYIDAYTLEGVLMWRIDLGRNIRSGQHYTQMVAFDLDGDKRADIVLKTADGTIDGRGKVIGSASADHRNSKGYVLSGPEYLTIFNGVTGAAMQTVDFVPGRGTVSSWGDSYGNRVDRFLAGVAYVDGSRPSAIIARGYYTRAVISAWDWRHGKLSMRWVYDSGNQKGTGLYGEGAHYFDVADVDGDGKHDIIYGAATLSSDGKFMYRTGLGHGDALHVGDFIPSRPGQEVFMIHESRTAKYGAAMRDGRTGEVIWGQFSGTDVGRGCCNDIDPNYPGAECWSSASGLRTANGKKLMPVYPLAVNFGAWWDGDLSRELVDRAAISKWDVSASRQNTLIPCYRFGAASCTGTKATPVLSADILGDWREEVIWRSGSNTELQVWSTGVPTDKLIRTLMHDPQYRCQVAGQNMAYNQPPNPSFFLGNGMSTPQYQPIVAP